MVGGSFNHGTLTGTLARKIGNHLEGKPCRVFAESIKVRIPVVVRKPGAEVTREALIEYYKGKVASWWVPDDVVFVDAIPIGATGKMLKNQLREQFKDHRLPGV